MKNKLLRYCRKLIAIMVIFPLLGLFIILEKPLLMIAEIFEIIFQNVKTISIIIIAVALVMISYKYVFAENLQNVTFSHCYDGDTCTFNIAGIPEVFGKKISIRIRGIDAPEMRGKCLYEKVQARKAKKMINEYMKGAKKIHLIDVKRGKYFRIIADIVIDNLSITELMINSGLVRKYSGEKRKSWCD